MPPLLTSALHRAGVDRDVEQPVAGDVERDPLARRQRDRAEIALDQALIVDRGAEQRDIAAAGGVDRALVDHRAAAGAGESCNGPP